MTKKSFSLIGVLLILILPLTMAKPAKANWYVNRQGWLVYEASPNVLGDEVENKDEDKKENKGNEGKKEEPQPENKQEGQESKQEQKKEVEYFDSGQNAWVKVKTEDGKSKTEIQYLTGEKVKSETEGNRQETEMETSQFKLKLKTEDGQLKLEAETEDGEKTDLGEDKDNELEIEPDENDDKIRVATGSADGEMVFSRNRVRARTNFPLSVDLATNELIVTTPNGVKRVSILPDQAIANLLANNVIDRIESTDPAAEPEVELTETDGEPVYEVSGESDQKFLGFMPVKIKAKIKVSAETGEVTGTQQAFLARIIDFLSI